MALGTVWAADTWAVGAWEDGTWRDANALVYGNHDPAQWVIFPLTDVTGLREWTDYIPVQYVTFIEGKKNTYDDDGFKWVYPLGDITGLTAWVHYTPVYVVADPPEEESRYDDDGWIPIAYQ